MEMIDALRREMPREINGRTYCWDWAGHHAEAGIVFLARGDEWEPIQTPPIELVLACALWLIAEGRWDTRVGGLLTQGPQTAVDSSHKVRKQPRDSAHMKQHPLDRVPKREAKSRSYHGGLAETLRLMRDYMIAGSRQPYLIELAGRIVADAGISPDRFASRYEYDLARLEALYSWVRGHVAYVSDGSTAAGELREVVRDVEVTLRARSGDCNDHCTLVGALVLASFDPVAGRPPFEVWLLQVDEVPVHVFGCVLLDGPHRIVCDTAARPGRRFGELPGSETAVNEQNRSPAAPPQPQHTISYAFVSGFFS